MSPDSSINGRTNLVALSRPAAAMASVRISGSSLAMNLPTISRQKAAGRCREAMQSTAVSLLGPFRPRSLNELLELQRRYGLRQRSTPAQNADHGCHRTRTLTAQYGPSRTGLRRATEQSEGTLRFQRRRVDALSRPGLLIGLLCRFRRAATARVGSLCHFNQRSIN
jgi:hypothetical protein